MTEIPQHLRERAAKARRKADREAAGQSGNIESVAELTFESFCKDPYTTVLAVIAIEEAILNNAEVKHKQKIAEIDRKIASLQKDKAAIAVDHRSARLESKIMKLKHHEESLRANENLTVTKAQEVFDDLKEIL